MARLACGVGCVELCWVCDFVFAGEVDGELLEGWEVLCAVCALMLLYVVSVLWLTLCGGFAFWCVGLVL